MTTIKTSEGARLRVRAATGADYGRIRELIARAYGEYEATLPPAVFRTYLADLTDLDSRADADLLVAETDFQIVGTVTYYADASTEGFGWPQGWAGVRALAVDPAHRGLGVAGRLMETCLDLAYRGGVPVVCLHTGNFMPAAARLYEGLDFGRAPAHDVDVSARLGVEGDAVVALAYTRSLEPRQHKLPRSGAREITMPGWLAWWRSCSWHVQKSGPCASHASGHASSPH